MHRPSHGHLAILATGAAVDVRERAVGKVHAAPFCNGIHALVASTSVSARGNAAECAYPGNCSLHNFGLTPQPQSLKVASDGESSWTAHIPACTGIISAGSGVAALLYCAWMLNTIEPTEVGREKSVVNVNKIVTGAIFGGISLVGGAATFLESRTSILSKKIDDNMQKTMEVLMALGQDIAFIKGAITNSNKK